jgi:hypothetical protein
VTRRRSRAAQDACRHAWGTPTRLTCGLAGAAMRHATVGAWGPWVSERARGERVVADRRGLGAARPAGQRHGVGEECGGAWGSRWRAGHTGRRPREGEGIGAGRGRLTRGPWVLGLEVLVSFKTVHGARRRSRRRARERGRRESGGGGGARGLARRGATVNTESRLEGG